MPHHVDIAELERRKAHLEEELEHLQQQRLLVGRVPEVQATPRHGVVLRRLQVRPAAADVEPTGQVQQTVPNHFRLHAADVRPP